jgi:hypothetical protein
MVSPFFYQKENTMELVIIACCISGYTLSRPIIWMLGLK